MIKRGLVLTIVCIFMSIASAKAGEVALNNYHNYYNTESFLLSVPNDKIPNTVIPAPWISNEYRQVRALIRKELYRGSPDGVFYHDYDQREYRVYREHFGESFTIDAQVGRATFQLSRNALQNRFAKHRSYLDAMNYLDLNSESINPYAATRDEIYYGDMKETSYGIWAEGLGSRSHQGALDWLDGYKQHTQGAILGVEWSNTQYTLGLAGSYTTGKLKSLEMVHNRDVNSWNAIVYGQFTGDKFYVNASAGYGGNSYKSHRGVKIPFIGRHYANAKYKSRSWQLSTEIGYKVQYDNLMIMPNVGLFYYNDTRRGFTENKESYITPALNMGRTKSSSTQMPVAINVEYAVYRESSIITPKLKVAWVPEAGIKSRTNRVAYASDNYAPWSVSGVNRPKHGALIGAGVNAKIGSKIDVNIDYELELRKKYTEHRANAGLGIDF